MPLAARYTDMLRVHTALHALDVWRTYAEAFEGEIAIRQGHASEGIVPINHAIRSLEASRALEARQARESQESRAIYLGALAETGSAAEAARRCLDAIAARAPEPRS